MKALFLLLLSAFAYAQAPGNDYIYLVTSVDTTYLGNGFYKETTSGIGLTMLFYDENDNRLNKDEFYKRIDHTVNLETYTRTDSIITAKLYLRKQFYTLEKHRQKALMAFLQGISGRQADTAAVTMIHFYSGVINQPSELGSAQWKQNDKAYAKKLPKDVKINHYYVYQKRFGPNDKGAAKNGWLYDRHGFIENMFIPAHFNYNSTIALMPNGQCYTYFGEHGPEQVREGLKIVWGTK
jgi:hypothetical protein